MADQPMSNSSSPISSGFLDAAEPQQVQKFSFQFHTGIESPVDEFQIASEKCCAPESGRIGSQHLRRRQEIRGGALDGKWEPASARAAIGLRVGRKADSVRR